jgi:DNA invertase Pin-like site-specific DNA recombinase
MDCYVYIRVSTKTQAKHGYSLGGQEKMCLEYAKKLGLNVIGVICDVGTGSKMQPGMQKILDSDVPGIVVWASDRLTRCPEIDKEIRRRKSVFIADELERRFMKELEEIIKCSMG